MEEEKIEGILEAARKNLERGRAIATGIGVFGAVYRGVREELEILLRTRIEKDSLYGEDLSGKPELPGGGTEINDFEQIPPEWKYTGAIVNTLTRELEEETGLILQQFSELRIYPTLTMYPAWLKKGDLIDLAFVIPVSFDWIEETEKYREMKEKNQVRFFSRNELVDVNITSPRMRFLIKSAIAVIANE